MAAMADKRKRMFTQPFLLRAERQPGNEHLLVSTRCPQEGAAIVTYLRSRQQALLAFDDGISCEIEYGPPQSPGPDIVFSGHP